jgi:hypothetical protein
MSLTGFSASPTHTRCKVGTKEVPRDPNSSIADQMATLLRHDRTETEKGCNHQLPVVRAVQHPLLAHERQAAGRRTNNIPKRRRAPSSGTSSTPVSGYIKQHRDLVAAAAIGPSHGQGHKWICAH